LRDACGWLPFVAGAGGTSSPIHRPVCPGLVVPLRQSPPSPSATPLGCPPRLYGVMDAASRNSLHTLARDLLQSMATRPETHGLALDSFAPAVISRSVVWSFVAFIRVQRERAHRP